MSPLQSSSCAMGPGGGVFDEGGGAGLPLEVGDGTDDGDGGAADGSGDAGGGFGSSELVGSDVVALGLTGRVDGAFLVGLTAVGKNAGVFGAGGGTRVEDAELEAVGVAAGGAGVPSDGGGVAISIAPGGRGDDSGVDVRDSAPTIAAAAATAATRAIDSPLLLRNVRDTQSARAVTDMGRATPNRSLRRAAIA